MLQSANEYANLGLKVILVNGKVPALKGWQDEVTSNPEKLQELFKNHHTGIGLVTAKSNSKKRHVLKQERGKAIYF